MLAAFKSKSKGFTLVLAAAVLAVIGLIFFSVWSGAHNASDGTIVAALVAGLALTVVMLFKDLDILLVATSVSYTYAAARLLANSVGSFVDKIQGIVMFGDATQVGTITTIAVLLALAALLTVVAAFTTREKAK